MKNAAPLRAAIYARYSTDMQSPMSIRDQFAVCRRFAKKEGWHVVKEYSDEQLTSATHHRPGYQAMLGDMRRGEFDILLAEGLERISRDQEDTAALYKRACHEDVRIHTLAEGEMDAIKISFTGLMGAMFLEGLKEKTRRGLSGRIRDGKSAGGRSYGYRIPRGADGSPAKGELEINEEEAFVVRRIFREYAAGRSPLAIAAGLNEDGIPAPRHKKGKSGHWKQNTINGNRSRGTGILNNELYVGRRVWNRLRYGLDPVSRKRVSKPRPETDWETVEVPELRILDESLWEDVKARQSALTRQRSSKPATTDRNGLSASQALRRRKYLLSGLLECARCGGKLTVAGGGKSRRYYCANAKEKGASVCAGMPGILQKSLETTVLYALREFLMESHAYDEFRRRFQEHIAATSNDAAAELQLRDKLIREKEKVRDNLLAAVESGSFSAPLIERLNEVDAEVKKMKIDRAAKTPIPVELPENLPVLYREYVDDLAQTLSEEEVTGRASEEMHRMIDRVVVEHDDKVGHTVEIFGELAAMMAGADSKNAANYEAAARSLKLVAGAGFEPATFRL